MLLVAFHISSHIVNCLKSEGLLETTSSWGLSYRKQWRHTHKYRRIISESNAFVKGNPD